MSAFEKFKRLVGRPDVTIALPSDPFIAIDREAAIARLKLDEKGEANGRADYPPEDSESLDDVESEIAAEISEYASRAQIDASANFRVYGERISELALLRELSTVTGASEEAIGDYRATVIKRKGELALAKDAIKESYSELDDFKAEHGLNRPAHRGLLPIYAYSTIGIAWFIESAFNTAFLRVNDDAGLIGGFVAAAVVAAVNLLGSAFVGRKVWPYLFYRKAGPRVAAYFATSLWLVLLFAWNLLAGHFRDAKAAGLPDPEAAALGLFADNLFQFDSIYSYGLLGAGLLFAVVAAIAGFKMDDPYPGYGDIYRRHEDRCEDYAEQIDDAMEDLRDIRREAIGEAEALRDELSSQFRERGNIIASREHLRTRYRDHQSYLEDQANALLSYYRGVNTRSRTSGAPQSFRKRWELQRTELPVMPSEPLIDEEVERAQNALSASITTISAAYNEAIESFEHLDTIKDNLRNG
ncbi:hypothetical protein Q9K02_02935 [Qipengyuania sp. G39]|uniref:MFS transporter n=1 Tax=Qipengyuania profundimaris TaxID=3067652 RepID=A0ABT9HLS1_9SPHN|nr:hypothetical protein [Qipengyuania sp. G39]MDP4574095.1 hypothetical protein [Qipengyuania sp. G39]